MQELSLPDCYGHAGLSPEAANIALRIEPVKAIAANLTNEQVLDLVRFYFGLPVHSATDWFSEPIVEADPSFSMVANKRELSIIAMALLSHEMSTEESQFAVLATLVAHTCGKRSPKVYPQFAESVSTAAKDFMTAHRQSLQTKQIRVRNLNKELGASEEDLVPASDFATLNSVLKQINVDSQEMDRFLAQQVANAISPIRAEVANLREETDMLWWLIGGQSHTIEQPYFEMKEGRAAFLIGTDLAGMSRSVLGPRASSFLMNRALRENRSEKAAKTKIEGLPKLFSIDELSEATAGEEIESVRDICSVHNAVARASDVKSQTSWRKIYADDGSITDKTPFEPNELALQSFREALLLKTLAS